MKDIERTLLVCLSVIAMELPAQLVDFNEDEIERDFVYNLNVYTERYIDPVIVGYGLNNTLGWQNSAQTLEPFTFTIAAIATSTFTPTDNLDFNFNDAPFSDNLKLKDPSNPILPSVLGGKTDQKLVYEARGQTLTGSVTFEKELEALSGITSPFNATPGWGLMAGMGLPLDMEASIRFMPPFKYMGVRHYQIGGGLKHMVSRYFWDEESPLHISIASSYNFSRFTYIPDEYLDGEDQKMIFQNHVANAEVFGSYDTDYISLFGFTGMYYSFSSFQLKGTYQYNVNYNAVAQEAFKVVDPVDITSAITQSRAGMGLTFHLPDMADLSVAYQFSRFNSLSVSLRYLILGKSEE